MLSSVLMICMQTVCFLSTLNSINRSDIEILDVLFLYIINEYLNNRIHKDITGLVSDNYNGVIYRINYGK